MTEYETPDPGEARPESLIRTPENDSSQPSRATEDSPDDEDLGLRVDTEEWQEYPSPDADPAAPESIAERMTGPDDETTTSVEDAGRPRSRADREPTES